MENVFDTLCSALGEPPIKSLFLACEGIDLMVLMMKYVPRNYFVILLTQYVGKSFNLVPGRSKLWTMPCQALQVAHAAKLLLKH